jgi:hypothetical protein
MKKIMLYGLIFSILVNIFQLMYASKKISFEEDRFEKYRIKMNDSINKIAIEKEEGDYFSLAYNENAQNYLENYDVNKLMPYIKEKIMEMNDNPNGNKLIPFDKINQTKMIVNRVRFLNHRWIIADFSDGKNWGELIIKYFIEKDDSVSFETAESFLYPKQ